MIDGEYRYSLVNGDYCFFFAHQVIEKPSFAKLKMHFWNQLPKKEEILNSDGISFLNYLS